MTCGPGGWCLLLLVMVCSGVGGAWVDGGLYKDLVLALDPGMSKTLIPLQDLEKNIKAMLVEMSDAMVTATENRLSLGSVRVVLPHWWNDTTPVVLHPPQEKLSWHRADIRLQEPGKDINGYVSHSPHTLQVGQCGVPGRYITIHTTLLDAAYSEVNYGPRGQVLMHEWAHYRWGIFDEYGHPEDPKYPVSYEEVGDPVPSSCHEGTLEGEFLTSSKQPCPGDPNEASNPCFFFPSEANTPRTTKSSLMARTHLSEGRYCTKETHDPIAPTPQNRMCGGRSVWEVLNTHPDFADIETPKPGPPTVTFHRSPMTRVFFLFEAPPEGEGQYLKSLVQNFLTRNIKLYGPVEVGMTTFAPNNDLEMGVEFSNALPLQFVSNFDAVEPYIPTPSSSPGTGTSSLLARALQALLPVWGSYEPGTVVVGITWKTLEKPEAVESLNNNLLDKGVKLLVVNSKGNLKDVLPLMSTLQNTGGMFYVPDHTDATQRLHTDLDKYLRYHTIDDHKLYGISRQQVKPKSGPESLPEVTEISNLDKQINGYLKITPFQPDQIEIILRHPDTMRKIACNDGSSPSSLKLNCETDEDGLFFYFYTPETHWTVLEYTMTIENKGDAPVDVEATWSVVEDDANNPNVFVQVWSSEEAGVKAEIPEANKWLIYCQVLHSKGVLQNLEVKAEIEMVDGNTGSLSYQMVTLTDEGDGGVDVKAKDTVWSGQVEGDWPLGTNMAVTTLSVFHQSDIFSPFTSLMLSSQSEEISLEGHSKKQEIHARANTSSSGSSSSSSSSSKVLPIDPRYGECCLSYSDATVLNSIYRVNQVLRRPYIFTYQTTSPTGTPPTGTSPTGTSPTGMSSTGTPPTGTSLTGTSPTGTSPTGMSSTGTSPTGTPPTGTPPTGTSPTGTSPTGTPTLPTVTPTPSDSSSLSSDSSSIPVTAPTDPPPEDNTTTIIVVSVVASAVVLGAAAGGGFYYFKFYKGRATWAK